MAMFDLIHLTVSSTVSSFLGDCSMAAMAREIPAMMRTTLAQSSRRLDSFRIAGENTTLTRRLLLDMTTRRLGPIIPIETNPTMDPVRKTPNPALHIGDFTYARSSSVSLLSSSSSRTSSLRIRVADPEAMMPLAWARF